jgi:transcriptional regulator with XRE-family HTH domain
MKKNTFELLNILQNSDNILRFQEEESDEFIECQSLHKYLLGILEEKNLKRSEVIRKSGIDRGYAYDILAGKRIPSRDKVLELCFAIDLSVDEVQRLLKCTGYPQLYVRIERDSIILYALQNHFSLTDANILLYEMKQECLM